MPLETCQPARPPLLPPAFGHGLEGTEPAENPGALPAGVRTVLLVSLVSGAALLARQALTPLLQDDAAFLTPIFAVMVASWYGGARAGLLATALSAVGTWLLILRPFHHAAEQTTAYVLQLVLFVAIGAAISAVNEGWHRTRKWLSAHEHFLSTILEATPTGVLVLDAKGEIAFINAAAARLFGLGSGLLVGRRYTDIGLVVKPATAGQPAPTLDALLAQARPGQSVRLLFEDAAAQSREVEARITRLRRTAHWPGSVVLSLLPLESPGGAHV